MMLVVFPLSRGATISLYSVSSYISSWHCLPGFFVGFSAQTNYWMKCSYTFKNEVYLYNIPMEMIWSIKVSFGQKKRPYLHVPKIECTFRPLVYTVVRNGIRSFVVQDIRLKQF